MRGPGVSCCATRGPGASPCTCVVRSAGTGVPALLCADTGSASGYGGSCDAYTEAVAAAASADSLSS